VNRPNRIAVLAAAALMLVLPPEDSWAARGRSAGHRGSGAHHHHHARVYGGFFLGAPLWHPYPPPYYYAPDYSQPQYEPPQVYIEKFDGMPSAQTQGEIFCPSTGAYYPAVQDCPGGWQRVLRVNPL
jgi:hypothetical protein